MRLNRFILTVYLIAGITVSQAVSMAACQMAFLAPSPMFHAFSLKTFVNSYNAIFARPRPAHPRSLEYILFSA